MYFETGKLNATPYSILITRQQTEAQFEQAVKSLELKKPDCAIMQYDMVQKFGYSKDNPIDKYIEKNYTLINTIKSNLIYKIK